MTKGCEGTCDSFGESSKAKNTPTPPKPKTPTPPKPKTPTPPKKGKGKAPAKPKAPPKKTVPKKPIKFVFDASPPKITKDKNSTSAMFDENKYWGKIGPEEFNDLKIATVVKKIDTPYKDEMLSLLSDSSVKRIATDTVKILKKRNHYYYLKLHGGQPSASEPITHVPPGYVYIFIGASNHVTYAGLIDESGWLSCRSPVDAEKKVNLMASTVVKPQKLFGKVDKTKEQVKPWYVEYHTYFPGAMVDNIVLSPDELSNPPLKPTGRELTAAQFKKATDLLVQSTFTCYTHFPWKYEQSKKRYILERLRMKLMRLMRDAPKNPNQLQAYRKAHGIDALVRHMENEKKLYIADGHIAGYERKLKHLSDLPKHCPPGVYIIGSCRGGAQHKMDVMADVLRGKVFKQEVYQKYISTLFQGEPFNDTHPLLRPANQLTLPRLHNLCKGRTKASGDRAVQYMCYK